MTKRANESLEKPLTERERAKMIKTVAGHFEKILDALQIDHKHDHNTQNTPHRVAKMYVNEVFCGRYTEEPLITEFANISAYDQLIVVGPLDVKSFCSHHFMPFVGQAYIGVLPAIGEGSTVIGLSKYARIVNYFSRRPQIQEELTSQILSYIVNKTNPRAAVVKISSGHMCMSHRGVNQNASEMVTVKMHGEILENAALRAEFLSHCQSLEAKTNK